MNDVSLTVSTQRATKLRPHLKPHLDNVEIMLNNGLVMLCGSSQVEMKVNELRKIYVPPTDTTAHMSHTHTHTQSPAVFICLPIPDYTLH